MRAYPPIMDINQEMDLLIIIYWRSILIQSVKHKINTYIKTG